MKSKHVCSNIKHGFDHGTAAEIYSIIDELKEKYPCRLAMIDELQGLQLRPVKNESDLYTTVSTVVDDIRKLGSLEVPQQRWNAC